MSMVCVGTPSNENGSLCLDYVARAASQIGDFLRNDRAPTMSSACGALFFREPSRVLSSPFLERHSGQKGREATSASA